MKSCAGEEASESRIKLQRSDICYRELEQEFISKKQGKGLARGPNRREVPKPALVSFGPNRREVPKPALVSFGPNTREVPKPALVSFVVKVTIIEKII